MFALPRFLTVLAIAASLATNRTPAWPAEGDAQQQRQKFLAALVKERLDEELPKIEIKANPSGREITVNKNIVIPIDWSITLNGRFIELANKSTVEVTRLERQPDGSRLVTLVATAPIAGDIWCEIKIVGKTKVDFSTKAASSEFSPATPTATTMTCRSAGPWCDRAWLASVPPRSSSQLDQNGRTPVA